MSGNDPYRKFADWVGNARSRFSKWSLSSIEAPTRKKTIYPNPVCVICDPKKSLSDAIRDPPTHLPTIVSPKSLEKIA
jgi:hypothetical protein